MCKHAPHLDISTRLIVIMHSKEWRRSTNTGHFARLAVRGAEVHLHGALRPNVRSLDGFDSSGSMLVLFPGRGANPLCASDIAKIPRPLTLLVPDGNWNQTQHMMRRHPQLRAARPVCLQASIFECRALRHNPNASRMSTLEAIVQALGIIEGPETARRLEAFFHRVLMGMTHNSRRRAGHFLVT